MDQERTGFTLIELMIVVAIIGILAAIAVPRFADLINKSRESTVKGSLGALRSAISIYYSDTEGIFPTAASLTTILTAGGKYMKDFPSIDLPSPAPHPRQTTVCLNHICDSFGRWAYFDTTGHICVSCTHRDTRGSTWSVW
jgi:prepilin-type N-terminal cleavage/methylation domain-containing protein